MEKKLPNHWVQIPFDNIIKYQKGKKPKILSEEPFDDSLPYLDIKALEKKEIRRYADNASSNKLNKSSVAIVWDGARSGWTSKGQIGALGSTLAALSPILINVDYVYHYLQSQFEYINTNTRGTGIPHVDPALLWALEFPLPPLLEQERIATKLDKLFRNLDSLKTKLDNIPQLLKNFRQSVLTQAVTGKLTEEWREGKDLAEWHEVKLEKICNSITDGDHQAPPKTDIGIPFLVISNVSKGYFDFENVSRYVPLEYYENIKETRKPRKGDILYTVTGSYGIPLLVDIEKKFCFQRHIAILKPNNEIVSSSFLTFYLNSTDILNQANNVATGTAQKTVPLKGLRSFNVNIPEVEEQNEIVRRIEKLFAKADKIEAQYVTLKKQIENLPQAILAKAFKGELVEQLPTDGDAKELLGKIIKAKEELNKTKKKKK